MKTYLKELGYNEWKSFVISYTCSKTPPTDATKKEASENNTMAMSSILSVLADSKKVKVRQSTLAKEIWDKLQDLYAKEEALEFQNGQGKKDTKQVTTQTMNEMLKKPTFPRSLRKDHARTKVSLFLNVLIVKN
jgi:hypothetical protein